LILFTNADVYYQKGGPPRGWQAYYLTQEFRSWLRKSIKGKYAREAYYPTDWNLPAIGEVWTLLEAKDELMFKLTWKNR
jgi:hypothetical protein